MLGTAASILLSSQLDAHIIRKLLMLHGRAPYATHSSTCFGQNYIYRVNQPFYDCGRVRGTNYMDFECFVPETGLQSFRD